MAETRLFRSELLGVSLEGSRTLSLRFSCKEPGFRFGPGQWLDLYLSQNLDAPCGGYSFCSAPVWEREVDREFELLIRENPKHPVTSGLYQLKPGQSVFASEGQGRFFLEVPVQGSVLLIGGGIGVSPLLSMCRTLAQVGGPGTRFALIHSSRSPEEFFLREELEALSNARSCFRYIPVLSSDRRLARSDLQRILSFFDATNLLQVFVCGPGSMNEDVKANLILLGVTPDRIYSERWW